MAPHERRVLANWPEPLIRRGIAGGAGVYPFLGLTDASKLAPFGLVGVAGFEPTTSSSRTKRATKLRHTPWPSNYSPRVPPHRNPLGGAGHKAQ